MWRDDDPFPSPPGCHISHKVMRIRDRVQVHHLGRSDLAQQSAIHLDGMRAVEVGAQHPIEEGLKQEMMHTVNRQGPPVTPDQHSVIPVEAAHPHRALMWQRLSPILLFLQDIERKDFDVVAHSTQIA